jgi:hypothetical protein
MRTRLLLIAGFILLAGCGTQGVYYSTSITKGMSAAESDNAQCRGLGFIEGTPEFTNCRRTISIHRNIELNSALHP